MPFDALPPSAAWRHHTARDGFESAFFRSSATGSVLVGTTAAVEDGVVWVVSYEITVDAEWHTVDARVATRGPSGAGTVELRAEAGRWTVDGFHRPALDGCLDVDLESSSLTNTMPVHRLQLDVGARGEAPAAYVRALDGRVERLEQTYRRIEDAGGHSRYDYESPAFDFRCRLVYDPAGLVLDYPGIATRAR